MENRVADVREYIEAHDPKLYREAPLLVAEIRDSSNGVPGSYSIKGLASVYDKWSLDLGGFRERIMPGAFDPCPRRRPARPSHLGPRHVEIAVVDTVEAVSARAEAIDKKGLGFYSRVAPTTYARTCGS
jgi:phage head maturation protease